MLPLAKDEHSTAEIINCENRKCCTDKRREKSHSKQESWCIC